MTEPDRKGGPARKGRPAGRGEARAASPPDPSNIRPARERDLDRLAALWSAVTEHHRAFDPLWLRANWWYTLIDTDLV